MNPNEEYLDNLLRSMNGTEKENNNRSMTPEEIEAMFAAIEGEDSGSERKEAEQEEPAPLEETDTAKTADTVMLEDMEDMTQEDIDRLLGGVLEEAANPEEPEVTEESNEELDEINELLRKSDNNEAVDADMLAWLESIESSESFPKMPETPENDIEEAEKVTEKKQKKKRAKKEKKDKKKAAEQLAEGNANLEESESAEEITEELSSHTPEMQNKRPSLFSRLFAALTEEEEEPNEKPKGELASNSEENETILKELDEEDNTVKKKKKKKGKKTQNSEESDEAEDDVKTDKKKKKDTKPKKVKKEKKENQAPTAAPGKKVSGKKIFLVSAICLTLMAVIFIGCTLLTKFTDIKTATQAFYAGDYVQSYQLLYGKELNENEALLFEKSEVLLSMERRWDAYEHYLWMDKELEALDSLIQASKTYDNLYDRAAALNILNDVTAIYEKITKELNDKYQVSQERARELAEYEEPIEYTSQLTDILEEKERRETEAGAEIPSTPMEDVLPQEEELEDFNFIQ